jgi:hypothetical protein
VAALSWRHMGDGFQRQRDDISVVVAEPRHQTAPLRFTKHARTRGARRNVAPEAVDYVLAYGRAVQRTGVTFFFLGWRDMPQADRCASWATRLEGTIVVMAQDGAIITVYRNRRGSRAILRKLKRRIPHLDLRRMAVDLEPAALLAQATA